MWGSQWSKKLYECLADLLQDNEILRDSFHYHIILGKLNEDLKQIFKKYPSVTTYDFLSQSDMWILYQHCDISLTRGWTTSLAEQKLFNLKSIIVPIPRTHDQKLNAERYVKNFNDIIVEQSTPTTSEDLYNALISLIDYHKPEISINIHKEIWKAKHTILDHLLK
jgi:UDP-N-acetylglucosamine:LPS N-acetylglucosamine transferase